MLKLKLFCKNQSYLVINDFHLFYDLALTRYTKYRINLNPKCSLSATKKIHYRLHLNRAKRRDLSVSRHTSTSRKFRGDDLQALSIVILALV